MKSKVIRRVLRALITLLGAGVGAALALLTLQIISWYRPDYQVSLGNLVLIYLVCAAVFGLVFFFLSPWIILKCTEFSNAVEKHWDNMPLGQLFTSTAGLISGLVIAALTTQILNFMGQSIFTTAFSAIIYVVFGCIGLSIGRKRGKDVNLGVETGREKRFFKGRSQESQGARPKILDTSVIIDGRILDIGKAGFLEGEWVIPQFVLAELRHIADSSDSLRRVRGRRGLDVLGKIQQESKLTIRVEETDYEDITEVDVKLLRLAKQLGGVVVTNDYNLNKVAGVTGLKVLNINELANAVKPVVLPGEEMTVQIVKEGKEPGQGVGYLPDGTMIVVDNARRLLGETVEVVVTTVLQTSAGRMIFTRLKDAEPKAG